MILFSLIFFIKRTVYEYALGKGKARPNFARKGGMRTFWVPFGCSTSFLKTMSPKNDLPLFRILLFY